MSLGQINQYHKVGEDIRDIASLKFKVPIWINPPAKVKRSTLIEEIVTRVFATDDISAIEVALEKGEYYDPFACFAENPIQIVTTVGNYEISVTKGLTSDIVTLLHPHGNELPALNWQTLFAAYGKIEPNITKLRLKLNPDIEVDTTDVIGTIVFDEAQPNMLYFTPDESTLPVNTILPINDIIDPTSIWPGNGLPNAAAKQRYLLTSYYDNNDPAFPPGVPTSPWGSDIVAYPNDIIQFNGISWEVIFNSKTATGLNYVINNSNGSQYMFNGQEWVYSYYGTYSPGYWRIDNLIQVTPPKCPPNNLI